MSDQHLAVNLANQVRQSKLIKRLQAENSRLRTQLTTTHKEPDMRDYIENACEDIDSAMFCGDAFHDPEHRRELTKYIERWQREMASYQELDDELAEQQLPNPFHKE